MASWSPGQRNSTVLVDNAPVSSLPDGISPYEFMLKLVRDKVVEKVDDPVAIAYRLPSVVTACREIALAEYHKYQSDSAKPRLTIPEDVFVDRIQADLLGLGAVEPFILDEKIEDIAINGPDELCIFRDGHWQFAPGKYSSLDYLGNMINTQIAGSGQKLNDVTPIVDADLSNGLRLSAATFPVTGTHNRMHPVICLRVPRAKEITLLDMVQRGRKLELASTDDLYAIRNGIFNEYLSKDDALGTVTKELAAYLHAAVLIGKSIVVLGPTGVGKTTLLKALMRLLPLGTRILILEDTPELRIYPDSDVPNNVINVRTRLKQLKNDGAPEITQEMLIRWALRQRPEALTIGESRGPEFFDLTVALNTGHKNGLTSFHAESVDRMFARAFNMFAQSERGRFYDQFRVAQTVGTSFNIVIALEPEAGGRQVFQVAELTGRVIGNPPEPEMNMIFQRRGGWGEKLDGPLTQSVFIKEFLRYGFPKSFFEPH
jgi:pilus assembly protein CpaF